MPSKKKKYNARFPPARIKKIMQTDDDVGKVAAAVPVIISRALELFIESLISRANDITQSKHAKTLSAAHMKQAIESEKKFDFLRDLVASIPDVQCEEGDGEGSVHTANNAEDNAPVSGTRPWKTGRPRKSRSGQHGENSSTGRRRTEVTSDDESTEDADTDEGEDETGEDTTQSSGSIPFAQPPPAAQPEAPRPVFAAPPEGYNYQHRPGPYLSPFQPQGLPQYLPHGIMPPMPQTMGILPQERTFTPPVVPPSSDRGNTEDDDYDT
ncbi:dr1-associated corepressor-like [Lingula anatina]|uniref:Dr1-associated corepressor n=1 Tax=Lingula anatina TaxID=7574 RepID=A0A1S3HTY9_LINAN|nr:dr1-associated corepressor-like [Lingula anatina]|eukprot:XP_013389488.1 dr1-associated corepressor-like [Lingula anatina]